ncbi:hypothetical protein BH09MYX1_BH09MYX1_08060 [soil metagenome]
MLDRDPSAEGPRGFDYVPRRRRWFQFLLDIAVVVALVYGVYKAAWWWKLDCSWHGTRAECTRISEDSLGRRKVQQVDGIRGLAFQQDNHVGFVTDADHADELALFATHEVLVGSTAEALELRRFADEREPEVVAYHAGIPHPLVISILGLLAVFAWAFFTRTRRYRITIDPAARELVLSRGIFRGSERSPLGDVNVELEQGTKGTYRVCLRSKATTSHITQLYHVGTHHCDFVTVASAALASPR